MKHSFAYLIAAMVLVLALMPAAAWARAGEQPATAPAEEMPATAPEDSPKAALKAYNAAMRAGDVEAIFALQHADDERETRVAKAVARSEAYVGTLLVAAREKFGADGAAKLAVTMHDISDAEIDAAAVAIRDDRALLRFPSGATTTMIRSNGKWRASVAEIIRSYGVDPEETIDQVTRRGQFAKVLAQDITAAQVKSIEDAIARVERHERSAPEHVPAN